MRCDSKMTRMRQPLTALFCVGAFLCGASGMLPAFVAVAGRLDGDHQVLVTSSREKLQIRFHHEHEGAPGTDVAGDWALEGGRSNSPADHVIEFIATGDSLAQLPSLVTLDPGLQAIGLLESERLISIVRPGVPVAHARPPPGEATWGRCLRSVVLLV